MRENTLKNSSSSGGLLKSSLKHSYNYQEQLNNSISPANNTTSFISGGGHTGRDYGNTPGGGATTRTLDSSYDANYGVNNMSTLLEES